MLKRAAFFITRIQREQIEQITNRKNIITIHMEQIQALLLLDDD